MSFSSLHCKQRGIRSDCSLEQSDLIMMHCLCSHDTNVKRNLKCICTYAADSKANNIFRTSFNQATMQIGVSKVKSLYSQYVFILQMLSSVIDSF